jgi:putative protease
MVPKSVLNDLRRQAVEAVLTLREAAARHAIADPDALGHLREATALADGSRLKGAQPLGESPLKSDISNLVYSVLVRTLGQLAAALAFAAPRPSLVYCDFAEMKDYAEAVERGRTAGVPVGLATPRILKPGEEPFLETILAAGPGTVLVRNLGALSFFREQAPDLALVGDYSLNAANELAAAALAEMGLVRLTPSLDLDADNLKAMVGRIAPDLFEVPIHLHVPLFHMEHCPAASRLSEGLKRPDCGCPCRAHGLALRDRSSIDHPILTDAACRTTVFNANPRSLVRQVPELARLGVRHFRVEMLQESPREVERLLATIAETFRQV